MSPVYRLALCSLVLAHCTPTSEDPTVEPPEPTEPYQELYDRGITEHLGLDLPTETTEMSDTETAHVFSVDDGPVCLDGSPFSVTLRDRGSKDLLIFLQGGGACWSDFCLAIPYAPPGIPGLDILDDTDPLNPVADWNVLYVPYCDGSLFFGDLTFDDDGDGEIDRHQRGIRNISAALDLAKQHFPEPERVVFAGSSGGGFGALLTTPLVRATYPDTDLFVMNDAGVGVCKDGDPSFVNGLFDEFEARDLMPWDGCPDCFDDGHIIGLAHWQLEQDPELRMGMFSAYRDFVIATMFLRVDPARFETALLRETADLQAAFPDRYQRFLVEGVAHTALVGDLEGVLGEEAADFEDVAAALQLGGMHTTELRGVTVADWLTSAIERRDDWTSHVP